MRKRLLNQRTTKRLTLLVLSFMLLMPSTAWGETVTKTITFNKTTAAVTSNINGSSLSVSVTEQVGSGTPVSYDGTVNILDFYSLLSQYSCSEDGGAVFTLGSQADVSKCFTIEIPGTYPTVPSQVTLTVAYENSGTGENKIQVGDYGNGTQSATAPGEENSDVDFYNYFHPYRSSETSLGETTLIYTGNNKSGLGTNRDNAQSQCIYVYLAANATFTIKEATITYETDVYGLSVAGIPVTGVNANNILGDGKITFTSSTLTLSNAEITVNGKNAIESGLDNLTVNLVGDQNVITCQGSTDCVFKGTVSGATVTFTTDDPTPVLTGSVNQESNMFNGITPDYQNGLVYSREGNNFFIKIAEYGLSIGGEEITSASVDASGNITGIDGIKSGTVKFTPADNTTTPATPATLTLTNATLGEGGESPEPCSIESTLANLTIKLEGTNTLYGNISYDEQAGATVSSRGSLAFTGTGSLTISYSDGVLNGFSDVDFGDFNHATNAPAEYNATSYSLLDYNNSAINYVKITTETIYPIWVKGTQVTASNYSDVFDDGTVSFDPTGNKLSLVVATIDCSTTSDVVPVASTIKDLKVYLSGINTIKVYPSSDEAFVYAGSESGATLTFSTVDPSDYENLGMLTIDDIGSKTNIASGYAVKGLVGETSTSIDNWGNDNYNNTDRSVSGWKYEESPGGGSYVKLSYREVYDLWISSVRYCSDNLYNNVGDAFDPTTSTLTLTHLTDDSYDIIHSGLPDLTINIGDENELTSVLFGPPNDETIGATSGTLLIKKDPSSTASVNKLTLANPTGAVFSGFNTVTLDGLNFLTPNYTSVTVSTDWNSDINEAIITDEAVYDLWVAGTRVYAGNASDIMSTKTQQPNVYFDATSSTLTLNNADLSTSGTTNVIESGLDNLTVELINGSEFAFASGAYAFKGIGSDKKITFVTDPDDPGSLLMANWNYSAINGLTASYDNGLGLIAGSDGYSISTLSTPTMEGSEVATGGINVTLSLPAYSGSGENPYTGSTIYYSVAYADESVDETEYTAPFTMTQPGTVTAYLTPSLGGKSNDATGKYFGYTDAPFTLVKDEAVTPEIYPAIGSSDPIEIKDNSYTTDNGDVATFDAGKIEAMGAGSTTLSVTLEYGDTPFTVLNPQPDPTVYEIPITFSVTVGENLQDIFEGSNVFASYFRYTDNFTIPDGMKAYIITGIDYENNKVVLTELNILPGDTPLLLYKGTATKFVSVKTTEELSSGIDPTKNMLIYTSDGLSAVSGNEYVLFNGEYVKASGGIASDKCYLAAATTGSQNARGFSIDLDGEGTTGISTSKTDDGQWTNDNWYDLQGRRIKKPTKAGLYLVNGKKIVVNNK